MVFWIPLVVVLVADLATKYYATHGLGRVLGGRIEVIPGLLDFFLQHNTGGAFSMLNEYPMVITAVSAAAIVLIFVWARRLPRRSAWGQASFGLILGGALGNLWDRVMYGHVIDFVHFHRGEWYFATFNVADVGICTGIAIFIYLTVFTHQLDEPKPPDAVPAVNPQEPPAAEPPPPAA